MLSPNAVGSIDAIEYQSGASTEVRSEGSGPPLILLQILATAFVIYDPSFVLGPVNSGKAAPVAVDADALMPPSMDTLMPPMSDLSN